MIDSFIIRFRDGRYSYSWGTSPVDAIHNYLDNVRRGIAEVIPASTILDAPSPRGYLPGFSTDEWPGSNGTPEPVPGSPLYGGG